MILTLNEETTVIQISYLITKIPVIVTKSPFVSPTRTTPSTGRPSLFRAFPAFEAKTFARAVCLSWKLSALNPASAHHPPSKKRALLLGSRIVNYLPLEHGGC
ncbi:hypothetical protein CDAR_128631 [Caerostris darwini]|uniref:Uncharacterized protein n=1 Tax=Caerostris darwini TaxID=1538125 RepID=A0AAV4NGV4_9ARAC|nr:hypothetical protein CDAR_128631 [Caerostris darwini]